MKKLLSILVLLITGLCLISCDKDTTTTKKKTSDFSSNELNKVSYEYNYESYSLAQSLINNDKTFLSKLERFSATMSENLYIDNYDKDSNVCISPLSIYIAFAMLYNTLNEDTRGLLREFFGMEELEILQTKNLIKALISVHYNDKNEVIEKLDICNSIWFNSDNHATYSKQVLEELADMYECHAMEANFKNDNEKANQILREFIKEKTNDLIDQNFGIKEEVLFLLINCIYFKDIWGERELTQQEFEFTNSKGEKSKEQFNMGKYLSGRIAKGDNYSFGRIVSSHGYTLSLILPNEGTDIKDIYNADVLCNVNGYEYMYQDSEGQRYESRVIFPEFEVTGDYDVLATLKKHNSYMAPLFSEHTSRLVLDYNLRIDQVIHKTVYKVNKYGSEGAAVTIIVENKATSVGPGYEPIREELLLNRPFAYILSDKNGVIIFTGTVNNLK